MGTGPALLYGKVVFPLVRLHTTLGRVDQETGIHPDIDLAPLGLGMAASRRHAELEFVDGDFVVRDLGSRLGTCINGEPLEAGVARGLRDGDTVTFGAVTLTFDLEHAWPEGLTAEWSEGATGPHTLVTSLRGTAKLVGELPYALIAGQILLHYQPQADLATGSIDSVEALIRWRHPDLGLVSPARFVPTAEDSGFIRHLTSFALSMGAAQSKVWRDAGTPLSVSVNVSARDFEDRNFVERVIDTVQKAEVAPADLMLEVTESAVMAEPAKAIAIMASARDAGFRFGIDDFGAGESSLGYLSRLPVDEVKIDQAFARDLTPRNESIVRSAVTMAHDLGLTVVVEGVETEDVAERLRDLGCDKGQGWYFGKPVPADELQLS